MGEIVGTELKVLSQFGEGFLKGHSQIGFDARTSGRSFKSRKIRDCAAKSDPYRRAPYRKPTAWRVKSIASQNHARNDRHLGDVGQRRGAGAHGRALKERICAIADSAFRKHP